MDSLSRLAVDLAAMVETMERGNDALARPGTKAIRNRLVGHLRMVVSGVRMVAKYAERDALADQLWALEMDRLRLLCTPLPVRCVASRGTDLAAIEAPAPTLNARRGFVPRVVAGTDVLA